MSCCEIIPNQSVHWAVVHEDLSGMAKVRPARPRSYVAGDPTDSVTVEQQRTIGRDSIAPGDIGKGKKHGGVPKGHDGHFEVTLRFQNKTEAEDAALAAISRITQEPTSGMYNLVLHVRAIPRAQAQARLGPPNPYAQVCVIW
ncbi:MAG: hypothetical protein HYY76_10230 [Acidobacteria bacterium]|nr:hypothetical protein [Acidobacteriota bacterium]